MRFFLPFLMAAVLWPMTVFCEETECRVAFETSAQSAPQILAFKNSWLRAPDVNFIPVDLSVYGDIEAAQALIAEDADMAAVGAAPAVIALASKTPCLLICAYAMNSQPALFTLKKTPFKTVADLKDKKIGVASTSTAGARLLKFLNDKDIEVNVLKLPAADLEEALKKGEVDALVVAQARAAALEKSGIRLLEALAPEDAEPLLIVGNEKFVRANPEAVRGLVAGTLAGVDFIKEKPEAAGKDLAAAIDASAGDEIQALAAYSWGVEMDKKVIEALESVAKTLLEENVIDAIPDFAAKAPKKFRAE